MIITYDESKKEFVLGESDERLTKDQLIGLIDSDVFVDRIIKDGFYEFSLLAKNGTSVPEKKTSLPHNYLVSGAPGTGKSHYLNRETLKVGGVTFNSDKESYGYVIGDIINEIESGSIAPISGITIEEQAKKAYSDEFVTRVTFYEDYSYENFIGCYKPVPKSKDKTEITFEGKVGEITGKKIIYEFAPGPFIETYVKAKLNKENSFFLIIEEINRAKAASVFGDMFQLLDRDSEGISEYEIKPDAALHKYLLKELGTEYDGFMKLPSNMYIWATMNSADQGVMPLDSAFKRRWAQKYMDIDAATDLDDIITIGTEKYRWDDLRRAINTVITNNGFDEDRCIGAWYFKRVEKQQIDDFYNMDRDGVNPLIDKLVYYLRQDVFRRNPQLMFKKESRESDGNPGWSMSDLRRRLRDLRDPITDVLNIDVSPVTDGASASVSDASDVSASD